MRHLRAIITAVIGLGLLTLTGCSGSADPSTPPPASPTPTVTPATAAATPTTAPSATAPTPPAMPAAAQAHTKAGAKAFVKYFWDVVFYATNTGDTDAIRELAIPGCRGCEGGIAAINEVYARGGVVRGGQPSLARFDVAMLLAGDLRMAHVTVTTSFSPETIDMPGTAQDSTREPRTARDRLELIVERGNWRVAQLVVLS